MTTEQKLSFLHYLFASAWSDGELAAQEREILETILSGVDLPKEQVNQVWAWFTVRPDEPDWGELAKDPVMRAVFMRQAMVLAGSDLEYNMQEIAYLDRLRVLTKMEESEYYRIWKEVEQLLAQGVKNE